MSEHTKKEAEDIAIHVEMLLTDEMRAHAYADAKAHDLPFQIFRVLGGYREALAQIATIKAQRDELLAAAKDMLADLDSFDGPEKFIDGEYPHFSPCGRMLDMKHAARFRAAIANAEAKE
jgi:hypothetical protein